LKFVGRRRATTAERQAAALLLQAVCGLRRNMSDKIRPVSVSVKNVRMAALGESDWATAAPLAETARISPRCFPASPPRSSRGSAVSLEEAQRSGAAAVCALI